MNAPLNHKLLKPRLLIVETTSVTPTRIGTSARPAVSGDFDRGAAVAVISPP